MLLSVKMLINIKILEIKIILNSKGEIGIEIKGKETSS